MRIQYEANTYCNQERALRFLRSRWDSRGTYCNQGRAFFSRECVLRLVGCYMLHTEQFWCSPRRPITRRCNDLHWQWLSGRFCSPTLLLHPSSPTESAEQTEHALNCNMYWLHAGIPRLQENASQETAPDLTPAFS